MDALLDIFKCPVCLQYMATKIEECIMGHSVCCNCVVLLNICPICPEGYLGTRNFTLETIFKCLRIPCPNVGCKAIVPGVDWINHQSSCHTQENGATQLERKIDNMDTMLDMFKCPACLQYMATQIEVCFVGHSVCWNCFVLLNKCPICQGGYLGTRNFTMETVFKCLRIPCPNVGCKAIVQGVDWINHQSSCRTQGNGATQLESNMLDIFKCPVCWQYMATQIEECIVGHSVCCNCVVQLMKCPICQGAYLETRNFPLETIFQCLRIPCPHVGCKSIVRGVDWINHQSSCHTQGNGATQLEKQIDNMDTILDIFKCPVCLEYMGPEIEVCMAGHSVCCNCLALLRKCPKCPEGYLGIRNFALEAIFKCLRIPCPNVGCKAIVRGVNWINHQISCNTQGNGATQLRLGVGSTLLDLSELACVHAFGMRNIFDDL